MLTQASNQSSNIPFEGLVEKIFKTNLNCKFVCGHTESKAILLKAMFDKAKDCVQIYAGLGLKSLSNEIFTSDVIEACKKFLLSNSFTTQKLQIILPENARLLFDKTLFFQEVIKSPLFKGAIRLSFKKEEKKGSFVISDQSTSLVLNCEGKFFVNFNDIESAKNLSMAFGKLLEN